MSNQRKAEETAAERIKMLSPLLEENQDRAALAEKKRKVCEKYGISDRTQSG